MVKAELVSSVCMRENIQTLNYCFTLQSKCRVKLVFWVQWVENHTYKQKAEENSTGQSRERAGQVSLMLRNQAALGSLDLV